MSVCSSHDSRLSATSTTSDSCLSRSSKPRHG